MNPSLLLSFGALSCFVASFFQPFLCNDFALDLPIVEDIDKPCETLVEGGFGMMEDSIPAEIKSIAGSMMSPILSEIPPALVEVCKGTAEDDIQNFTMTILQENLGSMKDLQTHSEMTWGQCFEQMQDPERWTFEGQCCQPAKSTTEACVKIWMAKDMGLGEKKITDIIAELFAKGDVVLGAIIVLFSVLFPIGKVGCTIALSLSSKSRNLRRILHLTSKWSMADVFIAALSIVFFKSSSLGFAFTPQIGLYLFAAGAVLSSVAVMLIPKEATSIRPPSSATSDGEHE